MRWSSSNSSMVRRRADRSQFARARVALAARPGGTRRSAHVRPDEPPCRRHDPLHDRTRPSSQPSAATGNVRGVVGRAADGHSVAPDEHSDGRLNSRRNSRSVHHTLRTRRAPLADASAVYRRLRDGRDGVRSRGTGRAILGGPLDRQAGVLSPACDGVTFAGSGCYSGQTVERGELPRRRNRSRRVGLRSTANSRWAAPTDLGRGAWSLRLRLSPAVRPRQQSYPLWIGLRSSP